jgi:YegS/Rv2252/BmrU family lipid kinase
LPLPIKTSPNLPNKTKKFFSNNRTVELPLVIVNPKSAAGSTESRWAQIASDLRAHFGAFQVAFTKKQGDGIELAMRAAGDGRKFIIACGGDGTINEVANGILQSGKDIELGILPSGTGGDFRRTLNMPNQAREAAKGLREGVTKMIDVGKVTFLDHQNLKISRYFLNVSSFGLSAAINERVKAKNSFGWLPFDAIRGKAKFAFSTLQEVIDSDFTTVRVKIDDQDEKSLNTINFCVANSRYFGGGMKIAPDACIDDGFFDVVNIGDIKTAKILLNAYKLYNGTHLELEEVKSTLAKRIEVSSATANQTIFIETDGELPGKLPAIYEIVPQVLKVRVPKLD